MKKALLVVAVVGSWTSPAWCDPSRGDSAERAPVTDAKVTTPTAEFSPLRFPSCERLPFDRGELERLFEIELTSVETSPHLVERSVALDLDSCSFESEEVRTTIALRFSDREPTELVTTVRFADVPHESRARTIAVALAELVRLALSAAEAPSAQSDPSEQKSATPPAPESSRPTAATTERDSSWPPDVFSLAAAGTTSALSGELSPFWGGALDARLRFDRWRMRLGSDAARADGSVALGRVGVTATSLGAGVEFVLFDAPRFALGSTLRGTWLHAAGISKRGVEEAAVDEVALTLAGRASVEAHLVGPLSLLLAAEMGGYLRSVEFTGGGAQLVGFSGATGRLEFGIVTTFSTSSSPSR